MFFDTELLNRDYAIINYNIWKIPFPVQFTCSSMIELNFDLMGDAINDMNDFENIDKPLKSLFINIFPQKNESFCIFAWLKSDDTYYGKFSKQFMNLSLKSRCNYLNNMLPEMTDKIVISPRLWTYWGNEIQKSLVEWANLSIFNQCFELEKGFSKKWKYAYTPWNLFDCSAKIRK